MAYFVASNDTLAAYALSMPGDSRLPGSTPEQLRSVLKSGREQGTGFKFFFASFLFAHNLKIGLMSLCFGVLAGVPTVYLMLYNGMLLGAFTALHHRAGIYSDYWAWILPHGITEISAIVLCGGVGLLLGKSVLSPGELTRTESLRRAGNEAVPVCLGVAGMLVLAAIIESYLRQSHLSTEARLIFAGRAPWPGPPIWPMEHCSSGPNNVRRRSKNIRLTQLDELIDQCGGQLRRLDVEHVHPGAAQLVNRLFSLAQHAKHDRLFETVVDRPDRGGDELAKQRRLQGRQQHDVPLGQCDERCSIAPRGLAHRPHPRGR